MADPTQYQQVTYGLAPEVAPYAQQVLGMASGLTDITQNPYMQYQGERFAQFSPLQQQSFTGALGMQPSEQTGAATQLAGTIGGAALGYNQYQPNTYQPVSFTAPGTAEQYMNPYMQQVLAPQLQAMQRQADIQRNMLGAQAAKSGAFGGARTGLMDSQLNAELMRQQQQATGQAYGQAYGQAQQQFNQEQAARAGAAQLGEQSRQFGAGLGLQGLQTGLQAAGQLGSLGGQQFGQQMGINQLQAQLGAQQQQQMQNILTAQYQDYLNAQNYPYKQLGFMSDLIRGVPLTQTGTALYQAPPSTAAQIAGIGAIGKGFGMFKKGGAVRAASKPAGLSALVLSQAQ